MNTPFPIYLVCGAPGAGKSTVVRHALTTEGQRFAHLGVAGLPVSAPGRVSAAASPDITRWRQDLVIELGLFAQQHQSGEHFDGLFWEIPPGIEPMWALELFDAEAGDGHLQGVAEARQVIAVLDAPTLAMDLVSDDELSAWDDNLVLTDPEGCIAEMLMDQIEVADVLLLHRSDCVSDEAERCLLNLLERLNPGARVLAATLGEVDLSVLVGEGGERSDLRNDLTSWVAVPRSKSIDGIPDDDGVSQLQFTADRPFHPQRLWEVINDSWDGVVRSKGLLWVASRCKKAGWWSQAAGALSVDWVPWKPGAMTRNEWNALNLPYTLTEDEWKTGLGQPRQEVVLVGIGVDLRPLNRLLQRALLTDLEWEAGESAWRRFPDPFPVGP